MVNFFTSDQNVTTIDRSVSQKVLLATIFGKNLKF